MDKEPIGRRHRGDKVKIIEERSADSQGFPGAKWLKFERPIGGHPESWVLSSNTERVLMKKEKGNDCTWSVVLYPPKNEKPERPPSLGDATLFVIVGYGETVCPMEAGGAVGTTTQDENSNWNEPCTVCRPCHAFWSSPTA